jgi:hypothetical protein
MSDLWKIVLTSSLTVAGGVTIYTLGRWIEKFWIDPIVKFEEAKGKVMEVLMLQANYRLGKIGWASDDYLKTSDEIKSAAGNFASCYQATFNVPKWIAKQRRLDRGRVNTIIDHLLVLSGTSLDSPKAKVEGLRQEILKSLGIK